MYSMYNLVPILFSAGLIVFALITIGLIFSKLYNRASKEVSFVRTGFGGQKVIMNGGALVFPVLHEIIPVNMNTLRLEVMRSDGQALITRNRMRVDVVAEFYVRVQPTVESIANAAQTLGRRTMRTDELKELVEGKFVDALRSVAAEMSMEELHEKRTDFVQKVQMAVSEDLLKNGLELEAVSLTGLDQTGMEFFNPNNAFDAEGLTRLTEEIEKRKKMRNDIERDTAVQIQNKNLETEKLGLDISRDEEYARLQQEREVSIRKAQQAAEISEEQAIKEQDAQQAQILSKKNIEQSRITADRAVAEERIDMERQLREKEILKERSVETQQIEKLKTLDLAEQDKAIAIAEKSRDQSVAEAEADIARAKAVQAEEEVNTVREKEIAERKKSIELIEAAKEAEREAIAIKIAAEAGKVAASDEAEARREEAGGQADQIRIIAQADAESEKLRAEASAIKYEVDAKGKLAINEAENILSSEQITMQVKVKLIENLDAIIRESVKPMEQIDSIKVIQIDGLNGGAAAPNGEGASGGTGSLSDQVVNSALKYRAQAPLLDSLLQEVGISGGDINGITQALNGHLQKSAED